MDVEWPLNMSQRVSTCLSFLTLDAPRTANCPYEILKLVITKFLRLVFVHRYFTAGFYIINIMYLLALNLANIPQF